MDRLKEEIIKLLWKRFINQIENEWQDKYTSHGLDINSIDAPTKFAWDVCNNMKSYFAEKRIKVKMINPYTLHNYFQRGGFSIKMKLGTLDLFSMYLGYERFSGFMKENEKSSIISSAEEENIKTLINEANKLEFDIYKSIPELEGMSKLRNYFTANGTALKLIKGYIDGILRNGRKLRLPGSFFEILSIETINISNDRAEVKTQEKWRLLWYKIVSDKNEAIYDILNEQMYYLKKIKGEWKIQHNEYSGKLEKIVD